MIDCLANIGPSADAVRVLFYMCAKNVTSRDVGHEYPSQSAVTAAGCNVRDSVHCVLAIKNCTPSHADQ